MANDNTSLRKLEWQYWWPWLRRAGLTARYFLVNLGQDFIDKGCQKSAAALTYMTLFAIVPLMTVTYSMVSAIPSFQGIGQEFQSLIFTHFVPESGQEVQEYLAEFSSQARKLTAAGVGMLVVTAYMMLTNIEKNFNAIWGVTRARRGLSSFLLYWAVLSIGPLLIGMGMAMSTYLLSLKLVVSGYENLGFLSYLFRFVPWILTGIAFTLLFAAVPNCRVPIKYAAIAGFVTALFFELFKDLFTLMVANSSIQLIYGAFAVVPLFLLWINILWMIILGGAVLTRSLTERRFSVREYAVSDVRAALMALEIFYWHSRRGQVVTDRDCVKKGLAVERWHRLRDIMLKAGWIAMTDNSDYVLRRSLDTVTLWNVADAIGWQLTERELSGVRAHLTDSSHWQENFSDRHRRIREFVGRELAVPLAELFAGETLAELEADTDSSADKRTSAAGG